MDIRIKRIYESPSAEDGQRILVDRLWPRGLSKTKAKVDFWLKEIAPSAELRKWFGHDPSKWAEFKQRYFAELKTETEAVQALIGHVRSGRATLLFGTREKRFNNAVALKQYLESHAGD